MLINEPQIKTTKPAFWWALLFLVLEVLLLSASAAEVPLAAALARRCCVGGTGIDTGMQTTIRIPMWIRMGGFPSVELFQFFFLHLRPQHNQRLKIPALNSLLTLDRMDQAGGQIDRRVEQSAPYMSRGRNALAQKLERYQIVIRALTEGGGRLAAPVLESDSHRSLQRFESRRKEPPVVIVVCRQRTNQAEPTRGKGITLTRRVGVEITQLRMRVTLAELATALKVRETLTNGRRKMINQEIQRARVAFSSGSTVEWMYAIDLGKGRYALDNSPFHVYGISAGDVFSAEDINGDLFFVRVLQRGGHSTYRVRLPVGKDHQHFLAHWEELQRLGCAFEGSGLSQRRLYALDLPPSVDVAEVYQYLEEKEKEGVWDFEEAHYFDQHGEEAGPGLAS